MSNVSYSVQDSEPLYIKAKCGIILSEIYKLFKYEWIIPLDGTESKRQISGSTTISNGEMRGGSSYLTDYPIPLTEDWELSFEGKHSPYYCAIQLVHDGVTSRDTRCMKVQRSTRTEIYVTGISTGQKWFTNVTSMNANTYYPITITKQNNQISIKYNNFEQIITPEDWDLINATGNLHIGVDTWGGTAYLKNVKLIYI